MLWTEKTVLFPKDILWTPNYLERNSRKYVVVWRQYWLLESWKEADYFIHLSSLNSNCELGIKNNRISRSHYLRCNLPHPTLSFWGMRGTQSVAWQPTERLRKKRTKKRISNLFRFCALGCFLDWNNSFGASLRPKLFATCPRWRFFTWKMCFRLLGYVA